MRIVGTVFVLALVHATAALADPVIVPYGSGHIPTAEENRRLADEQRKNWEQIEKDIEAAVEEYERRFQAILADTRDERDAYDARIDAWVKANPVQGLTPRVVSSVGEDGLYEGATVQFRDPRGNSLYEAKFDAGGNTEGLVQTAYGKAQQSVKAAADAVREGDETLYGDWSFTRDIYGNAYPSEVVLTDRRGVKRAHLRFNEEGLPYWSERFSSDGIRRGGAYQPNMAPRFEDLGPELATVPFVRLVTQPCEACRTLAERRNDVARELNAVALDLNDTAARHKAIKGASQPPLRMRHEHLLPLWNGFKRELDRLHAELLACEKLCRSPPKPLMVKSAPIAVCTVEGDSEDAIRSYAKGAGLGVGATTTIPAGAGGGAEGEVRVPVNSAEEARKACEGLPSSDGIRIVEKTPCSQMADEKPPVRPWARGVQPNLVEGAVARGADFSPSQGLVIGGEANLDISVDNFIAGLRRGWRPGDARGPAVTRPGANGTFRLAALVTRDADKAPLSERLSLGSLDTVDYDRVVTGVNTGRTAGRVLQKLEYLKYKYDNGLTVDPSEIASLTEDINALRGDRFPRIGNLLETISTNANRGQKLLDYINKGNEILDFIDLASRGRDDPVVAAEALSKYLSLLGSVAGKVPGIGEFVNAYAQGVEGMVDNLRFIQRRHNLTVEAIRDIEGFTEDFYGVDVELEEPVARSTGPTTRTKEEVDAINRYRATADQRLELEAATDGLRIAERAVSRREARIASLVRRIGELEDKRLRMGNERALWHDYDAKRRLRNWYQSYVRQHGTETAPQSGTREANWWLRGRNITSVHVIEARDRLLEYRNIDPAIQRLIDEIEVLARERTEWLRQLPRYQQTYLNALRAFVEKDTFFRLLGEGVPAPQAQRMATEARDRIPATVSDRPRGVRVAGGPTAERTAQTVTVATVCQESGTVLRETTTTGDAESLEEWAKRVGPPIPEDSALLHEYDPSELDDPGSFPQ